MLKITVIGWWAIATVVGVVALALGGLWYIALPYAIVGALFCLRASDSF